LFSDWAAILCATPIQFTGSHIQQVQKSFIVNLRVICLGVVCLGVVHLYKK
jgi:hypothetical protein